MAFFFLTALLALAGLLLLRFAGSIIYNLFFHPLRDYPGPLLHRATKIPKQVILLRGALGSKTEELHRKYGEVVRLAPDELSYIQPQAWKDIFGRPGKKEMIKDQQFFGMKVKGAWNLVTAPHDDHARMRRLFTHAFSNTALKAQEPLLVKYVDQMVNKIGEVSNKSAGKVNIVDLFNFCTFDIMAELAFGEPLRMLETTDYIPWVRVIFDGLKFVVFRAVLLDVPVLGPLLETLTASTLKQKSEEHLQFAADLVDRRLAWTETDKPDLWSFVLAHNDDGKGLTLPEMHGNAATFMVAGTETTATNLSGVIYYLCKNPRVYHKLVDEIRTTFKRSDEITLGPLGEMQYLNAVLHEGLRIYIPGGGGMTRIVPPEGADICGRFVSGGTYVTMNHYVAYRHEANFSNPLEFIPERWIQTSDPRFSGDRREVHEPFSYGPRNCIGKNLAWLELRLLLTKTLWHYDLELCPESERWTDQKSYLTWEKGPLMVKVAAVRR
ncbi:cytochrome P450 [Xylariaceae sp. FL0016]|nr:cytochrome P450 [Xylariaceae sp. FL0016]